MNKMNRTIKNHYCAMTLLLLASGLAVVSPVPAAETALRPNPASPAEQEEVLTNATIIELKELGLGESLIVEKIKTSRCNFDVSINGLKQLKSAGVSDAVIGAMLSAKSAAKANDGAVAAPANDSNDPNSPHEPGIWLYEENDGTPRMTKLEPSVYSQSKTGVGFFMQFGQTVKNQAVIRSAHAEIETTNRRPVFYFYFEKTESGLSDARHNATSPNEYILSQFEVSEKDNARRLVMGSINAYSGTESGAEGKSVRSFSFQKLAPGVYKVTPKEDLANGEYGFYYGQMGGLGALGGGKVFDFRVKGLAETESNLGTDKKPKSKTK